MTEQPKELKVRKWLEQLQYQSWQLELLICGLSLALLLSLHGPIMELADDVLLYASQNLILQAIANAFGITIGFTWLFVVINLVAILVLRGLWIGAVGLRTLSDRIDFDYLNYSEAFTEALKHRVPAYDRYVSRLDQILSVIFAFTFLAIFMVTSVCLTMIVLFTGQQVLKWMTVGLGMSTSLYTVLKTVWQVVFIGAATVYGFDFITLGWMKKRIRLFSFYYPIYRVFGIITLSRVYRPLYYNLISNPSGRVAAWILIPYLLVVNFASYVSFYDLPYFHYQSSPVNIIGQFYDEERNDPHSTAAVSIPAKVIRGNWLEVFIRYEPKADDRLLRQLCGEISTGTGEEARDKMDCLSQIPVVQLNDSTLHHARYKFYVHPQTGDKGLLTLIDIAGLRRGEHLLSVGKKTDLSEMGLDTVAVIPKAIIPFWKD